MNGVGRRIRTEATAETKAFLRRKTAVFFTFVFPLILLGLFGLFVGASRQFGFFGQPPSFFVPGYLAVVVALTPLSRVGSTVARHRSNRRFEKLATTPLRPAEWLLAHTLVNVVLIGLASGLLLAVLVALGDVPRLTPIILAFLVGGITVFCAIGAILGRIADSQDGVIAASNGLGIPLVFLSETFLPPAVLPSILEWVVVLSPLTYFARGIRHAIAGDGPVLQPLVILAIAAVGLFVVAVTLLPWRT